VKVTGGKWRIPLKKNSRAVTRLRSQQNKESRTEKLLHSVLLNQTTRPLGVLSMGEKKENAVWLPVERLPGEGEDWRRK